MEKFKLPRKKKKEYKKRSLLAVTKENWEWIFFKRRVQVRSMEVILNYPEYNIELQKYESDPKLAKLASAEELLNYYKLHYPKDKLSHHFCLQNRHKWNKFNKIQ